MAYSDSKNPFYSDEYDRYNYGAPSKPAQYGSGASSGLSEEDAEFLKPRSRFEEIQEQKQVSMGNQLESTQRALASIYHSEEIGNATAEDLVHQGEQLDNIERKTDKINQDLKTSQRHITGIKSIFGSLKNWWSGEEKKTAPEAESKQPSKLAQTVETNRQNAPHPAMRLKGDTGGFYEDEPDFGKAPRTQDSYGGHRETLRSGFKEYDDQLDENLSDMSSGMTRLKGLAMGLGDEIQAQNDQIDRINTKVDRSDIKVRDQNRQMGRILGTQTQNDQTERTSTKVDRPDIKVPDQNRQMGRK